MHKVQGLASYQKARLRMARGFTLSGLTCQVFGKMLCGLIHRSMVDVVMISNLAPSKPSFAPAMPIQALEQLSAWQGPDFRSNSDFTHRLSDAEIGEVDAAIRSITQRRINHIGIDRHNFELPQLGKRLVVIRDDVLLRGQGFMVIRGLPVERYSIEEAAAAFLGIGAYIGKPVSQNGKGHILGHVKDLGRSIDDPTARIYQTTHRQTFHTDSVDIVALLCLKTAKFGGLSRIV